MPAVRIYGGNVSSGVTSRAWRAQVSRRSTVLDVRSIRCRADTECAWVMWEHVWYMRTKT